MIRDDDSSQAIYGTCSREGLQNSEVVSCFFKDSFVRLLWADTILSTPITLF